MPVSGTVTATAKSSGVACTARADAKGRFVLDVAPGAYELDGTSPLFGDGQYRCVANGPVQVSPFSVTRANVSCPMR